MEEEILISKTKKVMFFLFLLSLIIIIFGSYYFYQTVKNSIRNDEFDHLHAISKLKIDQITKWRNERLADAQYFANNNDFIFNTSLLLSSKNANNLNDYFTKHLSSINTVDRYANVYIVSLKNQVLFSLDKSKEQKDITPSTIQYIDSAITNKKILFTDFHFATNHKDIFLNIVAPILNEEGIPVAVLIFNINPASYLYPIIQHWPIPSKTSEAYIVKRDGDSVIFLSNLRSIPNSALNLKLSLKRINLLSVRAALGHSGIYEGLDYRNINVLADIRPIHGTSWFMVSKIDQSEVYSSLFISLGILSILVIILIIALGIGFLGYYHFRQRNIYMQLYNKEKELRESQEKFKTTIDKLGENVNKSEDRYRTLFQNMIDGYSFCKMIYFEGKPIDFIYLEVNEAFEKLTGLKNVAGKKVTEIIPEIKNDNPELLEKYGRVALTGNPEEFEIYLNALNMWFHVSVYSNQKEYFIAIFEVITERKIAEEKIIKVNRIYAVISQINQAIVRIKNKDELFKEVCQIVVEHGFFQMAWFGMVEEQTGLLKPIVYSGNESGYFSSIPKISIKDIPEGRGPSGTAIREGRYVFCNDIEHDKNMAIWKDEALKRNYRSSISLPIKVFGKIIGAFTLYASIPNFFDEEEIKLLDEVADDINFSIESIENEKKRKDIEVNLMKLSRAVEQSPVTIIITDIKGNIEYANKKTLEVSGYQLAELIGSNPSIFSAGKTPKSEYKIMWDNITSGLEWRGELNNKKKSGEFYWENVLISPIKNNKGIITHFLGIKEDITERKIMIEELIRAKDKAEEMSKLKSLFLANMSHELRTPLIGINGFAEILSESLLDQDLKEMSENILKSGHRLSETFNLILDITRFESEKTDLNLEQVEIVSETEDIIKLFKVAAFNKGLYLNSSYENSAIVFNIDERAYRTALNNLVNNALKYTIEGGVNVHVGFKDNYLEINVSDTGIGIAEKDYEIIFEEFRQASEGFSRNFEGTGLGLSITKKIVEKFGGTINVKSELGKGSTFTVKLPIIETKAKIEIPLKVNKSRIELPKDIIAVKPLGLAIDDDPLVYMVLKRYLDKTIELDWIADAESALIILKQKKYDLIFTDINLKSGMDGVQLVKEIRKMKGYETIPIIANTAYAMENDREEFLAAGCSHYLSKPFTRQTVMELIVDILQRTRK